MLTAKWNSTTITPAPHRLRTVSVTRIRNVLVRSVAGAIKAWSLLVTGAGWIKRPCSRWQRADSVLTDPLRCLTPLCCDLSPRWHHSVATSWGENYDGHLSQAEENKGCKSNYKQIVYISLRFLYVEQSHLRHFCFSPSWFDLITAFCHGSSLKESSLVSFGLIWSLKVADFGGIVLPLLCLFPWHCRLSQD